MAFFPALLNLLQLVLYNLLYRLLTLQVTNLCPSSFVLVVLKALSKYEDLVKLRTYKQLLAHLQSLIQRTTSCRLSTTTYLVLLPIASIYRGQSSTVGIKTRYALNISEGNPQWGGKAFCSPNRLWDPPSLLYSGYRE